MRAARRWAACALALAATAMARWVSDSETGRVARPELDLRQAGLFRLPDGGLVLRVRCAALPPTGALRVLLGERAESGEVEPRWMIEGDALFRRPMTARGWTWDESGGVAVADSAFGVRSFLLPVELSGRPWLWAVETLDPGWRLVDRLPDAGWVAAQPEQVAEMARDSAPPADQRTAPTNPPALAIRWPLLADGDRWAITEGAPPRVPLPNGTAAQLRLSVRRPEGAAPTELHSTSHARDEARERWAGSTDGLDWTLVASPGPNGEVWFGLEIRSDAEARLEVAVEARLPDGEWYAPGLDGGACSLDGAWAGPEWSAESPIGLAGRIALWPLATVAADGAALTLANDPEEPHPCRFEGRRTPPSMTMVFPVAVSAASAKFPGRACIAWYARGTAPQEGGLRPAMAWWHSLSPPPATPLLPRQWVATAVEAAAARVLVGDPVAVERYRRDEPEPASASWRFVRLRPWVCELPKPKGWDESAATVLRLLRFHAAVGGAASWNAQAALLGAVRSADDALAPSAAGAPLPALRVPVSADPDLLTTPDAAWNRAMLDWACALHFLDTPGLRAFLFDALEATTGLDYNRASLAAADRALCWGPTAPRPAVARSLDAWEFVSSFRHTLGDRRPALAMVNPMESHAVLAPAADLVLFEDALDADPRSARGLRYRLLSGRRPCLRVLSGDFEWSEAGGIESALAATAAMGFIPVMGRDPAGRPYWSVPAWAARDAAALRVWVPLAARWAAAGWNAVAGGLRVTGGGRIETFGGGPLRHVVIHNDGAAPREIEVSWPAGEGACWVSLFSGECGRTATTGQLAIARWRVGPGEVAAVDLVERDALDDELAWLDGWAIERGCGPSAAANLRALGTEAAAGVSVELRTPTAWILGRSALVRAVVHNRSVDPLVIADVRWSEPAAAAAPLLPEPRVLGGGESVELDLPVDEAKAGRAAWLTASWRFQRGDREWAVQRRVASSWGPVVEVGAPRVRRGGGTVAEIELRLRNRSDERQTVTLEWSGDFPGDSLETILEPFEARAFALPVVGVAGRAGRMEVRARLGGREVHRADVRLRFPASAPEGP